MFRHELAVAALLLVPVLSQSATVPAGTELHVRLTTEVSSDKPSGQPVTAVVTAPVFVNGELVIDSDTPLHGKTSDAEPDKPAANGTAESPATLKLVFDSISGGGHSEPIACTLFEVDNARETVEQSGLITGIKASDTYASRIDQGISKVSARSQGFGSLLQGIESAILTQKVDPSITFASGTDMVVKLAKPLNWSARPSQAGVGAIQPAAQLVQLVASEPSRTVAENPPSPSDLTNLMFLGSADQLQQAFQKAGWFAADPLTGTSKMQTARAIIDNSGYKEAPVSILFLDGRPPDMTYQKQTDTFAKRHHIRMWKRPGTFDGKDIWVAAATHDTSITYSQTAHNFTHGIDPHIDVERAKVVSDLLFTKMVHAIALVDRNVPPDLSNATGDKLITDGKMAVLEF